MGTEVKDPCFKCGGESVWIYMPDGTCACDDHVPRGCTCNLEPIDGDFENEDPANWEKLKDEQGRDRSCCEWWTID